MCIRDRCVCVCVCVCMHVCVCARAQVLTITFPEKILWIVNTFIIIVIIIVNSNTLPSQCFWPFTNSTVRMHFLKTAGFLLFCCCCCCLYVSFFSSFQFKMVSKRYVSVSAGERKLRPLSDVPPTTLEINAKYQRVTRRDKDPPTLRASLSSKLCQI